MTTQIVVHTNGNYVCEVRDHRNPDEVVTVGPGNDVQKTFYIPHGTDTKVFDFTERNATEEEIEAAKAT